MSSGRPTLGDLIRSIDYSNIKSYDGRPDHPVTKLKALKHECVDDGISFNELKVGLLIYLQWIDFLFCFELTIIQSFFMDGDNSPLKRDNL